MMAALSLLTTVAAQTPATRPAITAEITNLGEFRGTRLGGLGLSMTLRLNGDIADPHGIRQVHITECRDNLGTDLSQPEFPIPSFISAEGGRLSRVLNVSQAPRRAEKISVLKGEALVCVGGKTETLTFDRLKSRMGTKLSNPLLIQTGLEVYVGRVSMVPATMPFTMPATFARQLERYGVRISQLPGVGISEVRLLDADGSVKYRTSSMTGTKQGLVFSLNRQTITDAVTLQIDVYTGAELRTVPFELRDIELP